MKVTIVEKWTIWHPEKEEKFEYLQTVLWQGEANAVYFRPENVNMKQPNYVSLEGELEIVFSQNSNVKIREDNQPKIGQVYLWCEPAIDEKELQKIKEARTAENKKREEILL